MKNILVTFTVLGIGVVAGASNGSVSSDREAAKKLKALQGSALTTVESRQVAGAMTDFGLMLQKSQARANVNQTTSPFSLVSAFGLVLNGARGQTLSQVAGALTLRGVSAEQFDRGYALLRKNLLNVSGENIFTFGNAIFADRDFPIRESYLTAVKQSLGADARSVNFSNPAGAAAEINAYVEEQTRKMIRQIVEPETVRDWRTALVNAGYFKGAWEFKFDDRSTVEDADFDTGRGKKKMPMMYQRGKTFLYHRGEGFQMASLAYKNGDFAMDLIVPDQVGLDRMLPQLTGENYQQWLAQSRPTEIVLGLPRFEVEDKKDMSDYFKSTMPLAFSDLADFGLLSPEPIKLDKVIHATILKVNEEGTEGAFATVIGAVRATSVMPVSQPEVIADRPFILVIRHTATGVPIFVSTVWEPKALVKP